MQRPSDEPKAARRIVKHILVVVAFVLFVTNASAQSTKTPETLCPRVTVSCASSKGCLEEPSSFMAYVSGAAPELKLSYEWTAHGGQIVSGQGTPQVTVVADRIGPVVVNRGGRYFEEMRPRSFTATVKVSGAPAQCVNNVASMAILMEENMVPPVVVLDQFGLISFSQLKMKLDSFTLNLQSHPGWMGYIVSDGKWSNAKPAIQYLLTKGINAERLRYVPGNKKKLLVIKLYLVPVGAAPPKS
jgi:hypothetical protein